MYISLISASRGPVIFLEEVNYFIVATGSRCPGGGVLPGTTGGTAGNWFFERVKTLL